jgi:hypothetical protein
MDRWSLPGPAGFIGEVIDALREGASVVVGASSTACKALALPLEDRIADEWRITGPIAPSGLEPLDEIYAALDVDDDPSARRSAASLTRRIESKRVIMITGVEMPHWPAWQRFLDDYANASRSVPAVDRSQLLVITSGVPKGRLPSRAPALIPLIWDGVVGEADVFSYVIQSLRRSGGRVDAHAKLVARIITRLALWDFDLVDRLLGLDPRELFDPTVAVQAAASGVPALQQLGTRWEDGGSAEFDGESLQHAIALVRGGDPGSELKMRLWAAQASELLPALELCRRQLAKRMKDARLHLPVDLNGEMIHDLLDVEIGPLLHLARRYRLPPDIVRVAEKLWHLRNKLAHLVPLEADEALDPELHSMRRR